MKLPKRSRSTSTTEPHMAPPQYIRSNTVATMAGTSAKIPDEPEFEDSPRATFETSFESSNSRDMNFDELSHRATPIMRHHESACSEDRTNETLTAKKLVQGFDKGK